MRGEAEHGAQPFRIVLQGFGEEAFCPGQCLRIRVIHDRGPALGDKLINLGLCR